jgi:hypothetical protein
MTATAVVTLHRSLRPELRFWAGPKRQSSGDHHIIGASAIGLCSK